MPAKDHTKTKVDDHGRECTKCGVYKHWSGFNKKRAAYMGHESMCRHCRNPRFHKSRACKVCGTSFVPGNRRGKVVTCSKDCRRTWAAIGQLMRSLGLSERDARQYIEFKKNPEACCAICGGEGRVCLHVDHCHDLGHVRGVLCDRCNKALGAVEDDPDLLRLLAVYLEQDRKDPGSAYRWQSIVRSKNSNFKAFWNETRNPAG